MMITPCLDYGRERIVLQSHRQARYKSCKLTTRLALLPCQLRPVTRIAAVVTAVCYAAYLLSLMVLGMDLRWKVSFSASCLNAAAALVEGLPAANSEIAAVLHPPTEELVAELHVLQFDVATALHDLTGLTADYENNRQLVEVMLRRARGTGSVDSATVARLAGCIADLEAAWLRQQPNLVEELAVRGRPLREQWEARGPGLLRSITRLTDDMFLAPSAEVVLVCPLVGGHGRAHLHQNRVTLEAVLTNPQTELPETLRLGWLLAQLHLDVPTRSEPVSAAATALARQLGNLAVGAGGCRVGRAGQARRSYAFICDRRLVFTTHLQPTTSPHGCSTGGTPSAPAPPAGRSPLAALDQMLSV